MSTVGVARTVAANALEKIPRETWSGKGRLTHPTQHIASDVRLYLVRLMLAWVIQTTIAPSAVSVTGYLTQLVRAQLYARFVNDERRDF
jgi:hypothetical protein